MPVDDGADTYCSHLRGGKVSASRSGEQHACRPTDSERHGGKVWRTVAGKEVAKERDRLDDHTGYHLAEGVQLQTLTTGSPRD